MTWGFSGGFCSAIARFRVLVARVSPFRRFRPTVARKFRPQRWFATH
jgi:hypothetical protein